MHPMGSLLGPAAAQVPDNVHQETLLHIRMQWWRDAIKSAYADKPQPHPVILALKEVSGGTCMRHESCSGSLPRPGTVHSQAGPCSRERLPPGGRPWRARRGRRSICCA